MVVVVAIVFGPPVLKLSILPEEESERFAHHPGFC
jgi:hypothetical protein